MQKSASHYTEAAYDEIEILRQVADGESGAEPGSRCVVQLLDSFEHTGPHGQHVCMVFEVLGDNLLATTRLASGGLAHQATAAIENACLDACAKARGVPVYALFGGPYRQRVPVYWTHCGRVCI